MPNLLRHPPLHQPAFAGAGPAPGLLAARLTPTAVGRVVAVLRVAVGLLMISAVFGQLALYLVYWRRIGIHDLGLRIGNFFSAFTFEVNLAGGVLLIIGAVLLWRGSGPEPSWYSTLRLCALAAIVVTGVVYNLLLRPLPVPPGSQLDWANEVLHVVAPLAMTLDWVLAPRHRAVGFRAAGLVVLYPLAWAIFTFIRGALVRDELAGTPYFYPYPFLDPHGRGGWAAVGLVVGGLTVFTLLVGVLAVLARRLEDGVARRVEGHRSEPHAASTALEVEEGDRIGRAPLRTRPGA